MRVETEIPVDEVKVREAEYSIDSKASPLGGLLKIRSRPIARQVRENSLSRTQDIKTVRELLMGSNKVLSLTPRITRIDSMLGQVTQQGSGSQYGALWGGSRIAKRRE